MGSLSPEKLQAIQAWAAEQGKHLAQQAFGESGPDINTPLDVMEQASAVAALGVIEGLLTVALQQQAQKLPHDLPCPVCQRLCLVEQKPRPLAVLGGQLNYPEPFCYCPTCRRDFFPPQDSVATGRPRLQS